MDVALPIMSQNHKDEQYAKANRWHGEEIDCD
jgi:hypothetical protein